MQLVFSRTSVLELVVLDIVACNGNVADQTGFKF